MMRSRDYRDLVIEDLTGTLLEREADLIEALRDRAGYRSLAVAALERIADLTTQNGRLQHRVSTLVAELRPRPSREAA